LATPLDGIGSRPPQVHARLESAQDLKRVAECIGKEGTAPPWLSGREGAASDGFVARSPGMPPALEGLAFGSRPLFSLHEGAWSTDRLAREASADAHRPAPAVT
jgi:hypothetical protein